MPDTDDKLIDLIADAEALAERLKAVRRELNEPKREPEPEPTAAAMRAWKEMAQVIEAEGTVWCGDYKEQRKAQFLAAVDKHMHGPKVLKVLKQCETWNMDGLNRVIRALIHDLEHPDA